MDKKEIYEFLEDPGKQYRDPDDRALTELYREVTDLETPDPGQDYWNQFNYRLQKRLEDVRPARRRFSFGLPLWLGVSVPVVLILVAVFMFPRGNTEPSLEDLDAEALVLISEALESVVEDDPYEGLQEGEIALLLDVFDPNPPLADEELDSFDAEAFKAFWRRKG